MKKILSLILVMILLTISMTSCFRPSYTWGATGLIGNRLVNAKVTSDGLFYSKDNVAFDLFIGLYELKHQSSYYFPEEWRETFKLAVYVSNKTNLGYEVESSSSIDYENIEGAKLLKSFSYDEAFFTDFGYSIDEFFSLTYNHKDEIIIPEEFFNSDSNSIYIYVIEFLCYGNESENTSYEKNFEMIGMYEISIEYNLISDYVILDK